MIYLSIKTKYNTLVVLSVFFASFFYAQTEVTAKGRQAFCIGEEKKIVTDFTITNSDASVTGIESFFIQISSGYQVNNDKLELIGTFSNISHSFDVSQGKLTLFATTTGTKMLFSDLEAAVKEVVFKTSAANVDAEKTFSLTSDNANYLPLTDHFYEFVPSLGITWADAKVAAENRPLYFGRKGYLATLTSQEESDFAGKQASGAGWIGATDEETEGVWKWVTGPEAGTIFWQGNSNGTVFGFANWNFAGNEPNNNTGNEHYAHITDPALGYPGTWNDLKLEGDPPGLYHPKGYIVEYGAPGDPKLDIVATTSIYIPKITATKSATICETGTATISAIPSEGTILWFNTQTGGTSIATGNDFTTPVLTNNRMYYAAVSVNGCVALNRTAVNVIVNQKPTITSVTDDLICSGAGNISANASAGVVYWYDSLTSIKPVHTGNNFTTPNLLSSTIYYVEANIDNCISSNRVPVHVIIDATIPDFDIVQNTYALCKDIGSVTLETTNPQGNYTYEWKNGNTIVSSNSSTLTITSSGNYSVKAISAAGCISVEKSILVTDSEIATITKDDVLIIDDSDNNSIRVMNTVLGIGDYEYSLDDEFGVYKSDGFFDAISPGNHTLFIKDRGNCRTAAYSFLILSYPKFFTPNDDGKNDLWKIQGYDKDFYTVSDIYIYNRFGVLIYKIDANSEGWDGRYQGKKLSSNSYWFKTILTDINGLSVEKKGSFSLIN